mmetsp:Transcript_95102/g.212613  ORF Transcript_95102/g.212613 Transcript_95102/m.212613 type:complete len:257 (-) Transcript_95102:504-1274(-)
MRPPNIMGLALRLLRTFHEAAIRDPRTCLGICEELRLLVAEVSAQMLEGLLHALLASADDQVEVSLQSRGLSRRLRVVVAALTRALEERRDLARELLVGHTNIHHVVPMVSPIPLHCALRADASTLAIEAEELQRLLWVNRTLCGGGNCRVGSEAAAAKWRRRSDGVAAASSTRHRLRLCRSDAGAGGNGHQAVLTHAAGLVHVRRALRAEALTTLPTVQLCGRRLTLPTFMSANTGRGGPLQTRRHSNIGPQRRA